MLTMLSKKSFFPLVALLCSHVAQASYPSLARNDYFPLHNTLDPHSYLHTRIKEQMQARTDEEPTLDHFSLSISPFMQNASIGKDYCNYDSSLGCLNAKWSMLGLIMGSAPQGETFATTLIAAQNALFPGIVPINDPTAIDPKQLFGFYDFPGDYRKRGARFEAQVGLWGGFGLGINGGGSDINFRICSWTNLTTTEKPKCNSNLTDSDVNKYLMCKLDDIANELGIDMTNYHKSAWEDTTIYAYWRHAFQIDEDPDHGWERFLVIPHLNVAYIAPTGEKKAPNRAFGLPFGNNGHKAVGVKGGVDLDFTATIELGWELGFVHFFDRTIENMFVPTSELQQGIFPFKTTAGVTPGFNWHFGLHMQAHHFMDKLSFYGQWVIMEHMNDKIKVCNNDSAFKPAALERYTGWKAQVFNSALNYDISPNIGLGILWQAPLSQRNVFRSSTFMVGLNLVF